MSKSTARKSVVRKSRLSKAQRSAIARKAAANAWKTMHSAAYKRAAKKSKAAVKSFLANRKAA